MLNSNILRTISSYYFLFNLYTLNGINHNTSKWKWQNVCKLAYTTQNILGNDCKQRMSELWEKDQGDKYAEKRKTSAAYFFF